MAGKSYPCPLCGKEMELEAITTVGDYYKCKDCRFCVNVTAYGDRAPSYMEIAYPEDKSTLERK